MNPSLPSAILPSLRPGDLLLYRRSGFWSWAIRVKTWSDISHVETYLGDGKTHAARDGIGVGVFPISFDGLVKVRRPLQPFSLEAAKPYIVKTEGQKYDWFGLLRFFTVGKQSQTKQFCSEDATRLARAGGVTPFAEDLDADLVSPGELDATPAYKTVFNLKSAY